MNKKNSFFLKEVLHLFLAILKKSQNKYEFLINIFYLKIKNFL